MVSQSPHPNVIRQVTPMFQSITIFTDAAPSSFADGYSEEWGSVFLRDLGTYPQNYVTFQKTVFISDLRADMSEKCSEKRNYN
jgi:hypothetical protein